MSSVNIIFLQVKCCQDREQATAIANNDNHSSRAVASAMFLIYLCYYHCLYSYHEPGLYQALHILLTLQYFRMAGQCCDLILQTVKQTQRY